MNDQIEKSSNKSSNNTSVVGSLSSHPTCLLLRQVFTQYKKPFIIGISGDSGTGKTTYSDGIRRLLGPDLVKTITLDGYHTEDRETRAKTGHLPLDPKVNKLWLLEDHLKKIRQGETIDLPIYNHQTGAFEKPKPFKPSSVVIIEGLHALYPQFLPLLDFTIFADPSREIKWEWKRERDIEKRGHKAKKLEREMLKRESAYKRWIDFQKTSAKVVIKIFPSTIPKLARYELIHDLPPHIYKVELIMEPANIPLPKVHLPFDLSTMFNTACFPFILGAIPCKYWGKEVMIVHIDGMLSRETLQALEDHIVSCTGISVDEALSEHGDTKQYNQLTATQFTQLLITWRFLEEISNKLAKLQQQ